MPVTVFLFETSATYARIIAQTLTKNDKLSSLILTYDYVLYKYTKIVY